MIISIKTAHGFVSFQPDGRIEYRDTVGEWERLDIDGLVLPAPPQPPEPQKPPHQVYPSYAPDYVGRERDWFSVLVFGKPFDQKTLNDLEPTLNAAGWLLTPPNAVGDRTKLKPPSKPWTRVGFGEKAWVWIEQPAENA